MPTKRPPLRCARKLDGRLAWHPWARRVPLSAKLGGRLKWLRCLHSLCALSARGRAAADLD